MLPIFLAIIGLYFIRSNNYDISKGYHLFVSHYIAFLSIICIVTSKLYTRRLFYILATIILLLILGGRASLTFFIISIFITGYLARPSFSKIFGFILFIIFSSIILYYLFPHLTSISSLQSRFAYTIYWLNNFSFNLFPNMDYFYMITEVSYPHNFLTLFFKYGFLFSLIMLYVILRPIYRIFTCKFIPSISLICFLNIYIFSLLSIFFSRAINDFSVNLFLIPSSMWIYYHYGYISSKKRI